MNLDQLKQAWNEEDANRVQVPKTIDQLKKAENPLDKLKDNMRKEWFLQIAAIAFLAIVPILQDFHPSLYAYYYIAYASVVIISTYYLLKFKKFYSEVVHYSHSTKESLIQVYEAFHVNIKHYHQFGLWLIPYCIVWLALFIYSILLEKGKSVELLSNKTLVYFGIICVSMIVIFVSCLYGWTKYYYKRYLNQIAQVIAELNETS